MPSATWVLLSATGWLCVIASLVLCAHAGRRWIWRVAPEARPVAPVSDLEPVKGTITAVSFVVGSVTLVLSVLFYP